MKIRIKTNSHLVSKHLPKLNLEYGYSVIGSNVENNNKNSWIKKVIYNVDKLFSFNEDLNLNQQHVITTIAQAANYLNETLKDTDYINNMGININVSSRFNKLLKKINSSLKVKNILKNLEKDVFSFLKNDQVYIFSNKKSMHFDSNINQHDNMFQYISKKHGVKDTTSIFFFHEFSHAAEIINYKSIEPQVDYSLVNFINNITVLNTASKLATNTSVSSDPNKTSENYLSIFFKQIKSMMAESYADVGAILLKRNFDINQGNYNVNSIYDLVKISSTIYQYRISSYKQLSNDYKDPIKKCGYANANALDFIINHLHLNNLPNRELTQKEIHSYCEKASYHNLSRFVLTVIETNKEATELIEAVLQFKKPVDNSLLLQKVSKDEANNNYQNFMKALIDLAGKDWYDDFNFTVEHTKKRNTYSPEKINELGLNPSIMRYVHDKIKIQKAKDLDKLQSIPPEDTRFNSSNLQSDSLQNNKNKLINSITTLRNGVINSERSEIQTKLANN